MEERRNLCAIWILTLIGGTCLVISCGTRYWQGHDGLLFDTYEGLWQQCTGDSCSDVKVYEEGSHQINSVRACMILGILFIILATLMTFLGAFTKIRNFNVMTAFEILGVLFCVTAMSVYTHYLKKSSYDYMWSYILGWVGCVCYGIAVAACLFLGINK